MAKLLRMNTADIMAPTLEFPPFDDSLSLAIMANLEGSAPPNKLVEEVVRTPGRQPSPQPTHFSVPNKNGNGNGHRILRSATVGYVAPEFTGKKAQMAQG